jgi:hypothetical protein
MIRYGLQDHMIQRFLSQIPKETGLGTSVHYGLGISSRETIFKAHTEITGVSETIDLPVTAAARNTIVVRQLRIVE